MNTGTITHVSEWKRFSRVFLSRGVVIFGMVVIGVVILTAIFAPLLAPYDPYQQDLSQSLAPPSQSHLLVGSWFMTRIE